MAQTLLTIYSLSFEETGGNWALREVHGFGISNNKLSVDLTTVY